MKETISGNLLAVEMAAVRYREAHVDDVPHIARVNSATLRECGLAGPEIYDLERLRGRWDAYLRGLQHPQHALAPRVVFGAVAEDELIGYIAGHFSTRHRTEGELQSIYVLPACHGRGVGTALLRMLAEWFVANGRRRVCVGIDPANPWKRFYAKHGARPLNPHWLLWDDIGSVL